MEPLNKLIESALESEARNARLDAVSQRERFIKAISSLLSQGYSADEMKQTIDQVVTLKTKGN